MGLTEDILISRFESNSKVLFSYSINSVFVTIGEAVNIILKENSHEIYSIIKGRLSAVFSDVLTELANQALRQIPESVYLEPSSVSPTSEH